MLRYTIYAEGHSRDIQTIDAVSFESAVWKFATSAPNRYFSNQCGRLQARFMVKCNQAHWIFTVQCYEMAKGGFSHCIVHRTQVQ